MALPENVVGEIIAGTLHASPRPAGPHTVASSNLGATLIPSYGFGEPGPGGWRILDEPELHFGEDVVVPDLAGWRLERMPSPPSGAFIELVPDWLCEVLSPSTARLDRVAKLPLYAHVGVQHVWLLDPLARTLEVLRLVSGGWLVVATFGGDDAVEAEPFDALPISLARLWG